MRCSSLLSPLAVVLAASPAIVSAQSKSIPRPPQFKAVFAGYFDPAAHYNATGPFGTRVHTAMSGGRMVDVKTGRQVATVLPFADDGVVGSSEGQFFPAAVMPLVWEEDGHFASVRTSGMRGGEDHTSWQYAHVETDSPTYSWMNSKFLIYRVDSNTPGRLEFTIYEESSPSSVVASAERERRCTRHVVALLGLDDRDPPTMKTSLLLYHGITIAPRRT